MPTVATMNQPYNLPPEQLFECFERFLPAERDPEPCWIWRGANTETVTDGCISMAAAFVRTGSHMRWRTTSNCRRMSACSPCIESRLCVNPAHATQQGERGRGYWSTLTINDARMDIARRFGLSRSAVG